MLEAIGLLLTGRAGSRLCERLAAPVSRMTLLRLIRALPDAHRARSSRSGWMTSRCAVATCTAR